MGVQERRARQKKFLRQEILDAASELFVRDGFANVSMRRIADKIEYSPTTIYLYFKDKAELLEQLCHETFGRLSHILTKISEQSGDPLVLLKRGLTAYIEFGIANPHHYRATFMMPVPEAFRKQKHSQPNGPGMQAYGFLGRAIGECVRAGKLKVRDVELASQTLWAGIHGITSLLITHERFPWVGREKIIRSVVDTLVAGISS
jgi:AcrR family transcriptional regulator